LLCHMSSASMPNLQHLNCNCINEVKISCIVLTMIDNLQKKGGIQYFLLLSKNEIQYPIE
jgi:chemotaxis receptor (MCP) glutamine deamidase CheD